MTKDETLKVPPFNEKAYVEKELFEGKRTLFMIAYCACVAILSAALGTIPDNGTKFGIVLGALGVLGVRPFLLYIAKLNIAKMKPKDWIVTVLFYVFGWLWLWLLLMQFIK